MKKSLPLVLLVVGIVMLISSTLPTHADPTQYTPGWTYYIVYNQADGTIVSADACSNPCSPVAHEGQAIIDITNQPIVVTQLFKDAYNQQLGNWHVNTTTHAIESIRPGSSVAVAPTQTLLGLLVYSGIPAGLGAVGALLSGMVLKRRYFQR